MGEYTKRDRDRPILSRHGRKYQRLTELGLQLRLESLESRLPLAADFGDAPMPYRVTLAENGARHEAIGPMLGIMRDPDDDGIHSLNATNDGPDDDGVTFGLIRTGQLGATATVFVSNAPAGARLDAWIDFNSDGDWSGMQERIAFRVPVVNGNNTITFDVPSGPTQGVTFGRFRLSTIGGLGIHSLALDGEVEDYRIEISSPTAGSSQFGMQSVISTEASSPYRIRMVDMDADSDMDLLSASYGDDVVAWYENDGTSLAIRHVITSDARAVETAVAVDLDGDGDTDVLSGDLTTGSIDWHENDGAQSFSTRTLATTTPGLSDLLVVDVEGDGDFDLLTASNHDGTVHWHENDGNQSFTSHFVYDVGEFIESIQTSDVDGDGDSDVIAVDFRGDRILWLQNKGSLGFTHHPIASFIDRPASAIPVDFDRDGDIDVVAAASRVAGFQWYENDGEEQFTVHSISNEYDSATEIVVADLDGDDDFDLALSTFDGEVVWIENIGGGSFTAHEVTDDARQAVAVSVGDVDGDGDLDLVSASVADDKIAWYENLFCGLCLDSFATDEDVPIIRDAADGLLSNDPLLAGESLIVAIATPPQHGTLELSADGSFTYSPDANYFGEDAFEYRTTSDRRGDKVSAVEIEVRSIPDLPIGVDDNYSTSSGQSLTIPTPAGPSTSVPIISAGATWRYLDDGSNQGTLWREASYNDSNWASGPAPLGYGDGDETTVVRCGPSRPTCNSNNYITTYFRREFTIDDVTRVSGLSAGVMRDDAIVVYINGVEVIRDNLPTGLIQSSTPALTNASDDGATLVTFDNINRAALVGGRNVIAVEIHQQNANSSDISFELALIAQILPPPGPPGVLANDVQVEAGTLIARLETPPVHGSVTLASNGSFIYIPNPGFDGEDSFTYRPRSSVGLGAPAQVTITVVPGTTDFGDAPAPYAVTLAENGARHEAVGPMLGTARDTENDGVRSTNADSDGLDDDGVTFDPMRVGQLGAATTVVVSHAPAGARLDAWVDFNGDGVWGGPGEQVASSVFVSNGNNTIRFDVPSWAASGQTFARFRLSTAGSLGLRGLATDGEVEDYSVTVLPPVAASASFGSRKVISNLNRGPNSVYAADINGDGVMDVLASWTTDDVVYLYDNDGTEGFTGRVVTTAVSSPQSVIAADVDSDGDVDILSASFNDDKVAWYENTGSTVFTARTVSNSVDRANSVFAADIDGDGDMDVLTSSPVEGSIRWHENNGSEVFSDRTIFAAAVNAQSVSAADVDGDGDMDVLSASSGDGSIRWYENNGSQAFMSQTITSSAQGAVSVFAADMDRDGDMDVVSASFQDSRVAWYENSGDQVFTTRTISSSIVNVETIFVADLDSDGNLDVISASFDNDRIYWHKNNGNRTFTTSTIGTAVDQPVSLFVSDVDDDGDLDVLSASIGDRTIGWYENVNPACVPCADAYVIDEDGILAVSGPAGVLANDSPQNGETLSARLISDPDHGTLLLAADGSFTYTPDINYFGADTFNYRVSSNLRIPQDVVVSITVRPSPDVPATSNDVYYINENEILTAPGPTYAETVLADNPTAYWRLSETSGTTVVDSVGGNHGQYVGNPTRAQPGAIANDTNTSVRLDGTDDYVQVPYRAALNPAADFSFEAWVRVDGGQGIYRALATSRDNTDPLPFRERGFIIYADIDDKWAFWTGNGGTGAFWHQTVGPDVIIGAWTHVVVTFQQTATSNGVAFGTKNVFVNGVLTANSTNSPYLANNDKPLRIGAGNTESTSAAHFVPGAIDDVAFYQRALTEQEIHEHYLSGVRTTSTNTEREGAIASHTTWRYFDTLPASGAYPRDAALNAWNSVGFNDTAWPAGTGLLAYGGISGVGTSTTLRPTVEGSGPYTYLFRKSFQVTDAAKVVRLDFELLADDGAVIYINGREALRHRMPTGLIGIGTFANGNGNEEYFDLLSVDVRSAGIELVEGTNIVAVEIHQVNATSSDAGFDMRLAVVKSLPPLPLSVLENDTGIEGEMLVAAVVDEPRHGVLAFATNGEFTYTPQIGFQGFDQFTYVASDGLADSRETLVTVNVGDANETPLAADDRFVVRNDQAFVVSVAAGVLKNDFDFNGDVLSSVVSILPERGTLSLAPNGSFNYTPAPGFVGVDSFVYRAVDPAGAFNVAAVTLIVVPKRDPINGVPQADDDVFEAITSTFAVAAPGVLANDNDPELRSLSAVVEHLPWHGSLSFAADGSFTYTPLPGFTGQDSFAYRATDGNTFSAPAAVTINVATAIPAGGLPAPALHDTTSSGSTSPNGVQTTGAQGSTTSPSTLPMSGDLNGDGHLDRADLALVMAAYGATTGSLAYDAVADLNGDGRVSLLDAIVLQNGMIGFSQPSSSNGLVRRASDTVSDEQREIESLMVTAARRSNATIDEVHSPGETSLRATRRNQAKLADIRALGSISPAIIDRAFASDAEPSTYTARRVRSFPRLRS